MNKKYVVDGYDCYCNENNIHIVDSYRVKNIDSFLDKLKEAIGNDFKYTRTLNAWSDEWYAHNLVYKFGLFRSHTKDVDLNEDEYKLAIFLYKLVKPVARVLC